MTHHPEVHEKLRSRWSAPAAMSAATGLTAEECAAAINRLRGRPAYYQTQSVKWTETFAALELVGVMAQKIMEVHPTTMRKFLENRPALVHLNPLILFTRDHYYTARDVWMVDSNHPNRQLWRSYPNLRSKVKGSIICRFAPGAKPGLEGWDPEQHNYYARKNSNARRKR